MTEVNLEIPSETAIGEPEPPVLGDPRYVEPEPEEGV